MGSYDLGGLQGQDGFKLTEIDTSEDRNEDHRLSASNQLPEITVARVKEHLSAIAQLMNTFHLRHMLRLYAEFDRDLVEAIVLGEVAHHNFSAIRTAARNAHELSTLTQRRNESGLPPLLPTNAYSIAAATGIPRESVSELVSTCRQVESLLHEGR